MGRKLVASWYDETCPRLAPQKKKTEKYVEFM